MNCAFLKEISHWRHCSGFTKGMIYLSHMVYKSSHHAFPETEIPQNYLDMISLSNKTFNVGHFLNYHFHFKIKKIYTVVDLCGREPTALGLQV